MVFWHAFKESLKLPSKKALFKLNRLGMDIVVVYMFILLLFVSFPSLIEEITTPNDLSNHLNVFFLIIYFFIFYYLPMTIIVFVFISLIAYVGKGITIMMKRKLHFSILWKMYAFSTTLPFALYTIIALFYQFSNLFFWISLLYTMLLFIKMISIYPKINN